MKKAVLLFTLACCSWNVSAQTAREDIEKNPLLSAGKYFAYQAPTTTQTAPPAGYKAFYLSSFARHGSRHLTKEKKYTETLQILWDAEKAQMLTPSGEKTLKIATELYDRAKGRYGELTEKGARQHRELIQRMFRNYPEVFADGVHVDARSTYKTRAFLSMAAACVELKGLNPKLNITTESSNADLYYIKYENEAYEQQHLADMDSVYHVADSIYIHPERILKELFRNADFVQKHILDTRKFMADLFELHGISQSYDNQQGLDFLFSKEEAYDMWQRNNFEWYYEKGPSPLSGGHMYYLEKNLLNNFIETADSVINHSCRLVSLRFGHDTNLAPLATLMGLNSLRTETADWEKIADTYRTYQIIPMCGNIQMVFYRNAKDNVLVKILLNEREATLPIQSKTAPYYEWNAVKDYWKNTLTQISLP